MASTQSSSMFLIIFFITPYMIWLLPSVLGTQTHTYHIIFTLAALAATLVIGNLYYGFSLASNGTLSHDWGCASQLLNWVLLLTHLVATLLDINVFTLPAAAMLIIFFPVMESLYWVPVGCGKEHIHLQIYGEIHDWIVVKWGHLWTVIITGVLERMKQAVECVKQAANWVTLAIDWVVNIIDAVSDLFPRALPNQHPEDTAGMDPPPYSSDFRSAFTSSSSCDVTVTLQGGSAKV
ncbi:hypothetical protein BDR03DRAFT_962989 [Suillus americanus]|nr:hypothetical protein BDR03DRAFT_962989 [Suillus americanus]